MHCCCVNLPYVTKAHVCSFVYFCSFAAPTIEVNGIHYWEHIHVVITVKNCILQWICCCRKPIYLFCGIAYLSPNLYNPKTDI